MADMIQRLFREQLVPGDPEAIWAFFATPRNLDRLTPPSLSFQVRGKGAERMYPGQVIEYRIGILPGWRTTWLTEITHVREGEYFVDEQRVGPYKLWHHEHFFLPEPGNRGMRMTDRVTYEVGWGPAGDLVHALWIRRKLVETFDYRARQVAAAFPVEA